MDIIKIREQQSNSPCHAHLVSCGLQWSAHVGESETADLGVWRFCVDNANAVQRFFKQVKTPERKIEFNLHARPFRTTEHGVGLGVFDRYADGQRYAVDQVKVHWGTFGFTLFINEVHASDDFTYIYTGTDWGGITKPEYMRQWIETCYRPLYKAFGMWLNRTYTTLAAEFVVTRELSGQKAMVEEEAIEMIKRGLFDDKATAIRQINKERRKIKDAMREKTGMQWSEIVKSGKYAREPLSPNQF